jgi:DNA-binding NarL/FixJ family response regulator
MNRTSPIRIMFVDDHPVLRDGLAAMLSMQPDMELVAQASSGEEAVKLYKEHQPDVTLMDMRLPGMSGAEAIATIRKDFPEARIIILTSYDGDEDVYKAFQAGAKSYLLKGMITNELFETIKAVHAGKRRIPSEVASILAEHVSRSGLSSREIEVLELLARGMSNKEIAHKLSLADGTIKSHIKNILTKLDANDRTHAAFIAIQRGILRVDSSDSLRDREK